MEKETQACGSNVCRKKQLSHVPGETKRPASEGAGALQRSHCRGVMACLLCRRTGRGEKRQATQGQGGRAPKKMCSSPNCSQIISLGMVFWVSQCHAGASRSWIYQEPPVTITNICNLRFEGKFHSSCWKSMQVILDICTWYKVSTPYSYSFSYVNMYSLSLFFEVGEGSCFLRVKVSLDCFEAVGSIVAYLRLEYWRADSAVFRAVSLKCFLFCLMFWAKTLNDLWIFWSWPFQRQSNMNLLF